MSQAKQYSRLHKQQAPKDIQHNPFYTSNHNSDTWKLSNTHNHNSTYATIMPPPCFSFHFVLCSHMLALFLPLWNVPFFPQLYPTTSWPFTPFTISTALFSLDYFSIISSLGINKYCLALVTVLFEDYYSYIFYIPCLLQYPIWVYTITWNLWT